MLVAILTDLTTAVGPVTLASSNEGGGGAWLLLLGPAGGAALYVALWNYYRNAGASHSFERETRVTARPVTGGEAKVGENNGTRDSRIDGANHTDHRQRVQRLQ
jgi:hypothetical protein